MNKSDAKRRIHIKRLSLVDAVAGTRRWVTNLAQTAVARQRAHIAGTEDVAHESVRLVHIEELLMRGGNARRILTAMLQQQQAVVNQLVHESGRASCRE